MEFVQALGFAVAIGVAAPPAYAADENRDGKLSPDEFLKAESLYDRSRVGAYVDDSVLTAKVKAALIREPQLKSVNVSVETEKGHVLLTGSVEGAQQRALAVKTASAVGGVRSVKDALIVH